MFSAAAERNKAPIAAVLGDWLPESGSVLEIASGSGQHVVYFAEQFRHLIWQPTDFEIESVDAIRRRIAATGSGNIAEPLLLDVTEMPWPVASADAVLCINLTHISPWGATESLIRGAAEVLADSAPLIVYGPFKQDGAHTSPGNEAFDRSLRARNGAWGIRDVETVEEFARRCRLIPVARIAMPANNLSVVLRRQTSVD